ncbi:MAG TPA: BA14K family protein [Bauldia sp.]|nr:BA14K family protein [Bauldia sp.]
MPSGDQAAGARERVEDQAYYRCLNLDEEPEFPTTSAYFGTADDEAIGGPFEAIAEGDADVPDEPDTAPPVMDSKPVVVTTPAVKPKQQTASASIRKGPSSSGLTAWSDEWLTWCKAHYKSFNATTGMVVTLSGEKRMCP